MYTVDERKYVLGDRMVVEDALKFRCINRGNSIPGEVDQQTEIRTSESSDSVVAPFRG